MFHPFYCRLNFHYFACATSSTTRSSRHVTSSIGGSKPPPYVEINVALSGTGGAEPNVIKLRHFIIMIRRELCPRYSLQD